MCLKQPGFVQVHMCSGFWLQVQWGQGWERCCCYLCHVGVPGLLCHIAEFPSCELWKGSWPQLSPTVCRALGVLAVSCCETFPRDATFKHIAHFWESKTCFRQSHEPHCWKVGIVPLIAPKRKREGRWLQHVVVYFVLKSISFFCGGRNRDSIVEQRN